MHSFCFTIQFNLSIATTFQQFIKYLLYSVGTSTILHKQWRNWYHIRVAAVSHSLGPFLPINFVHVIFCFPYLIVILASSYCFLSSLCPSGSFGIFQCIKSRFRHNEAVIDLIRVSVKKEELETSPPVQSLQWASLKTAYTSHSVSIERSHCQAGEHSPRQISLASYSSKGLKTFLIFPLHGGSSVALDERPLHQSGSSRHIVPSRDVWRKQMEVKRILNLRSDCNLKWSWCPKSHQKVDKKHKIALNWRPKTVCIKLCIMDRDGKDIQKPEDLTSTE